ncbi:MAG TPA: hypothetical protein EYQ73_08000, partial [Candidatus Poseidoniales archaeon]|nr:hypothetical protein [Candidatus Poseidoniales archaeon]
MARTKSVILVLLLLVSSLSGIAFSFDQKDTVEGLSPTQQEVLDELSSSIYVGGSFSTSPWDWVVGGGGQGLGIVADSNGNAYVTGYFSGTVSFGNTSLTSSGTADIFIAKLSSSGSWLWAVKAGGSDHDEGSGIAVDSSGDTYITGHFSSPSATFGNTSLSISGINSIFVAKISSTGSWQWAKGAGSANSNNYDEGRGISVSSNGEVAITGCIAGDTSFGTYSLTHDGEQDGFVATLDINGTWLSAALIGGSSDAHGNTVILDSQGNAYVSGFFAYKATFGNIN